MEIPNLSRTLKCPWDDFRIILFVPWSFHHIVSLHAAVLLTCLYSRVTQAAQLTVYAEAVSNLLLFWKASDWRLEPSLYCSDWIWQAAGSSSSLFSSSFVVQSSLWIFLFTDGCSREATGKQTQLYVGNWKAACCVTITFVVIEGYVLPT